MSEERREQRPGGGMQGGPMGRGGWGAMGMTVQKAKDFGGTALGLLGYFLPQKRLLMIVLVTAIIGTVFNIVGPKILGLATTKLFDGIVAKFQHRPGATVDFGYIATVLLILLGLYIISSIFISIQQYVMAGVAQRTIFRLRQALAENIYRLPLHY